MQPLDVESLGRIAVVPAAQPPKSSFLTFAKGAPAGAAQGAISAGGIAAGVTLATAPLAGPAAPLALVLGAVFTGLEAGAGAVVGGVMAVPAERAREIEAAMDAAVTRLDAQDAFAREVTLVTQRPLVRVGALADTHLEVGIAEIGFRTCPPDFLSPAANACPFDRKDPLLNLYMRAEARLVRASDGQALQSRQFRFVSARRLLAQWSADGARVFAQEIERGYRELAEQVNDELLLAATLELPVLRSYGRLPDATPKYGLCWLEPEAPSAAPLLLGETPAMWWQSIKYRGSPRQSFCPGSALHFGEVESLLPTLRWSPFPRELDRAVLDAATLSKIANVSYDLKIWNVEGCERGALAYARSGLPQPLHAVEAALQPGARYFWSVRARFTYEGRTMLTPWAFFNPLTCYPASLSDAQYHRFTTPKD